MATTIARIPAPPYRIVHRVVHTRSGGGHHVFCAEVKPGDVIGDLTIDRDGLTVFAVEVVPDFRGQGIATALYRYACDQLGDIRHAPPADRTDDYLAWMAALAADRKQEVAR